MREHLYSHLNRKFGVPAVIEEWATSIVAALDGARPRAAIARQRPRASRTWARWPPSVLDEARCRTSVSARRAPMACSRRMERRRLLRLDPWSDSAATGARRVGLEPRQIGGGRGRDTAPRVPYPRDGARASSAIERQQEAARVGEVLPAGGRRSSARGRSRFRADRETFRRGCDRIVTRVRTSFVGDVEPILERRHRGQDISRAATASSSSRSRRIHRHFILSDTRASTGRRRRILAIAAVVRRSM